MPRAFDITSASPTATLLEGRGLLPSLAIFPVLVLRIENEKKVLARELAGYEEYRRQVRWRLVPFVW